MASPSPSNNQLPTVWLAPPKSLLITHQNVKLDPICIAISGLFTTISIFFVLIVFNKKNKGSYLKDSEDAVNGVNQNLLSARKNGPRPMTQAMNEPPRARIVRAAIEEDLTMGSEYGHPQARTSFLSLQADDGRRVPIEASRAKKIARLPLLISNHERDIKHSSPETNIPTFCFDDVSSHHTVTLSEDFEETHRMAIEDLAGCRASFVPSEFIPLPPENVGLYGKIWK